MTAVSFTFVFAIQITIDAVLIYTIVQLIRRLKPEDKPSGVDTAVRALESILTEADSAAGRFEMQLEEKHRLIKKIGEQLDRKIISLNLLLNRADALLKDADPIGGDVASQTLSRQPAEILRLSKAGGDTDSIARKLCIPKEEVRLVLDLKNRLSDDETKA